jgi:hypothetical protein
LQNLGERQRIHVLKIEDLVAAKIHFTAEKHWSAWVSATVSRQETKFG